ncbi:(Fe-S)-binding protein [Eisenibacter elegans]|uniref:(Fe-S)-binding protein n=1 Tax=Eisenibacter elegans TaxID=997 RepID=UPI0003F84495|nr:(Fe-S)-binding protein [Eisenibacter elegans]
MQVIQQVAFIVCLAVAAFFISRRVRRIAGNIQLGRPLSRKDRPSERLKKMLLLAFGQQKMFDKPLIGLMHFIIYAGFLLINIEVLEIVIDGIFGTHRVFAPFLGSFYGVVIGFFEFLAIGVIITCVIFLIRRNVLKIERFHKPEMKGWPQMDGNLILTIEIVLMLAILTMNAADSLLQLRGTDHYAVVGAFTFSQYLMPLMAGLDTGALIGIERVGWWLHILGIMAFALYVTYSKHLHIFLAFPNAYFSNMEPFGKFENMSTVTREVKLAMGLMEDDGADEGEAKFGAKDVTDLTWKNLMDAYSCTECGRCTEQCPANITGKKLSPRKVMMDTRDRVEEVGNYLSQGKTLAEALEMGDALYSDRYISKEELMACNTCNACVEACPVSIDPLNIIVELRRHIAMEETGTPASWNNMFANIENNMAPWKFSPSDRFNWVEELNK